MKKVTVFTELRAEFSGLSERFVKVIAAFSSRYPIAIFCAMVAVMVGSLLLCFTLFRTDNLKEPKQRKVLSRVERNLGEIGTTASQLQRVLEIRARLEVLLAKDSLGKKDSLIMEQLLREIDKTMTGKK